MRCIIVQLVLTMYTKSKNEMNKFQISRHIDISFDIVRQYLSYLSYLSYQLQDKEIFLTE